MPLEERHDIGFGNTAVLAGTSDHRRIEIVLFEQPPNRRARLHGLRRCFLLHGRRVAVARRLLGRRFLLRRRGRAVAFLE